MIQLLDVFAGNVFNVFHQFDCQSEKETLCLKKCATCTFPLRSKNSSEGCVCYLNFKILHYHRFSNSLYISGRSCANFRSQKYHNLICLLLLPFVLHSYHVLWPVRPYCSGRQSSLVLSSHLLLAHPSTPPLRSREGDGGADYSRLALLLTPLSYHAERIH